MKRERYNLFQEVQNLKKKIEQLNREKEEAVRHLGEINIEMVYKDYGIHTIINYRINVVKRLTEPCIVILLN